MPTRLSVLVYTSKQWAVLEYVRERIAAGMPPTLSEIATYMECTPTAAKDHVDFLVGKGVLVRVPKSPRNLRLPVLNAAVPRPPRCEAEVYRDILGWVHEYAGNKPGEDMVYLRAITSPEYLGQQLEREAEYQNQPPYNPNDDLSKEEREAKRVAAEQWREENRQRWWADHPLVKAGAVAATLKKA